MRRPAALLKTRVARRLLALFTVSAFVPVVALAVVSLVVVNRQLESQSRERLRQLSKNAGQSILEQLERVEAGLRLFGEAGLKGGEPEALLRRSMPEVRAVALVDGSGAVRASVGPAFRLPSLSAEQRRLLGRGRMAVTSGGAHAGDLVVAVPVRASDPHTPVLWARLGADSLWSPAITFTSLPTVAEFCVLGPGDVPFQCRLPNSGFPAAFAEAAPSSPLGTFTWDGPGGPYVVGHWSFHPGGAFTEPSWSVLVAEPSSAFHASLGGFSTSFVLVLLLGLSLVFLLSNAQIRRTTEPLAALDAGTRRVASGDLATRVEVNTADEFGTLAASFNTMAEHLRDQFTQLAASRAVDQAVLTAFDIGEVVRAVLDQVPDLVPCRSSAVLHVDRSGEAVGSLNWLTSVPSLGGTTVHLEEEDLRWLGAHRHHGVVGSEAPPFVAAARSGLGSGSLIVFPFLVKQKVRGALILEQPAGHELDDKDIRRVRQIADQAAVAIDDVMLVKELENMSWGALRALARTIDVKSRWTAGHSERVTELALALGREMGLGEEDMEALHRGGLLHDIGKIGVPAAILDNPEALRPDERAVIERHPVIGARILEPIPAFRAVIPVVLQHHERWDGSGYPDGLRGEEIHPLARIVAVADAYDAMVSRRPYRDASRLAPALSVIEEGAGRQFDPRVTSAFLRHMKNHGPVPQPEAEVA